MYSILNYCYILLGYHMISSKCRLKTANRIQEAVNIAVLTILL